MTPDQLAAAEHFVYRLFDAEGSLLYVGCSVKPAARLMAHRSDQPWADDIDRQDVEGPFSRVEALRRESEVIRTEVPRYNVKDHPSPTRWEGPSDEAFLFVQKYVSLSGRSLARAFWKGEIPLEPTEADVWLWLRTLDTRYHAYPCFRSCRCGTYWSDAMQLAEDFRQAEYMRALRERRSAA